MDRSIAHFADFQVSLSPNLVCQSGFRRKNYFNSKVIFGKYLTKISNQNRSGRYRNLCTWKFWCKILLKKYFMSSKLQEKQTRGALLLCPCLFRPSDNMWRSGHADAPQCAHFSTVISPSWITEQISVEKCAHRGASARRERQTSFKIVPWTKQTRTKHHSTANTFASTYMLCGEGSWRLRLTLLRPVTSVM